MELQFSQVMAAAEVLGALAREHGGTIPNFQKVAADLLAARSGLASLDLEPVVVNLARHFGYKLASIDYEENDEEWWLYGSTWMLLSRSEQVMNCAEIRNAASTVNTNSVRIPLWTDDFASLFQILR